MRIIEFYCPGCAVMVENEYLPPGHPLTWDIQLDIDKLKEKHGIKARRRARKPAAQGEGGGRQTRPGTPHAVETQGGRRIGISIGGSGRLREKRKCGTLSLQHVQPKTAIKGGRS